MKRLSVIFLLLIPLLLRANPVHRLLDRLEPGASRHFVIEKVAGGDDFFELGNRGKQIVVRGNSYVNISMGIRWYLKYYLHENVSWNNRTVHFPECLPRVKAGERHCANQALRYDLNYCTHSYSMAFWDWTRWEQEIDWMALHGINLPLAITGTECVWYNVLKKLGYSPEEINGFIAGPGFLAWWLMNNLEGWGGPNPQGWYEQRLKLQQKIVKRMRELDIEPVFAGYSGMVPSNAREKLGLNVADPGRWCGYQRPAFLQPTDAQFNRIADLYYKEMTRLFGKANYYSMDPFHEGGAVEGVDLKKAGMAIMHAMKRCNERAVWVVQAWGANPRPAMMEGLEKGDLLVLDLYAESRPQWGERNSTWYREKGFDGHDWVYCMLLNYGGNVGLHGKMQHVIDEYFKAMESPYGQSLKGVGMTMEGIENNPVMFELLTELPWHRTSFTKEDWLKDYVTSRYGRFDEDIYRAWIKLSNSIYACPDASTQQGTHESVFCARPSDEVFQVSSFSEMSDYYDPQEVLDAAERYNRAAPAFAGNNNYEYDWVDLMRQAVAEKGRMVYKMMMQARRMKNRTLFDSCSEEFMRLLMTQDRLLSARKEFRLDTWLKAAADLASTEEEKRLYVWNAKVQITTWGNRKAADQGGLHDYAHREWSGLLKSFYAPRWERYIETVKAHFDEPHTPPIDYYDMEEQWVNSTDEIEMEPLGSVCPLAEKRVSIIPQPACLELGSGCFELNGKTKIVAEPGQLDELVKYVQQKVKRAAGLDLERTETEGDHTISLRVDPTLQLKKEGYSLSVSPARICIRGRDMAGLFYGIQSLFQLLPAEIESPEVVGPMHWTLPAVEITDEPRFPYRSCMLDPCRHFIPKEEVLKQLDVLSLFKINTLHLHLTDDQGWRVEIKKYPKLTETGARRTEGEGTVHQGYYTQEDLKEMVEYAARRFITIVPEIEMPGHELAAIAAYPELSCRNSKVSPRIVWGVEQVVMCPGKETMFTFLEDVIAELVKIFPGKYFHIGGDECPKESWKNCPLCQARIRSEHLEGDGKHTAEQYLQSYVVRRMEKVLKKYGKKLIGWDEILQGGLSDEATVMSWRGETGGIEAALQGHDALMASHGNGMYLDQFQGDAKIEPVSIGGYTPLERTYSYDPVPDTLKVLGMAERIKGVQCNLWSEYLYTPELLEYRMYPRVLALAEIAWTPVEKKNYRDFERRVDRACVRLDAHDIHYHIPQPEQPGGSCNEVVFTDSARICFSTSRPEKMVYSLDGSEPGPCSEVYEHPFVFYRDTVLKIRTLLASGKMSRTRVISVRKEKLRAAAQPAERRPGLQVMKTDGRFLTVDDLHAGPVQWEQRTVASLTEIRALNGGHEYLTDIVPHAAIATGYLEVPEDGVYYISSNNEEVWIDGQLLVNNRGEVKRFSRKDRPIALARGLHALKIVFLGHIIGGWPTWWDDSSILIRQEKWPDFRYVTPNQLFY